MQRLHTKWLTNVGLDAASDGDRHRWLTSDEATYKGADYEDAYEESDCRAHDEATYEGTDYEDAYEETDCRAHDEATYEGSDHEDAYEESDCRAHDEATHDEESDWVSYY